MSNAAEFVAGTDYLDPDSRLEVGIDLTAGAQLRFTAVSKRTYTGAWSDTLNPAVWRRLADVPARASNRAEALTDPGTGTARFYRSVTPIQP
jgi:hypothetical protein